ncbi:U-box domain-containing protein 13-like [Telopea speciosissima]|uniref:U-box domain-containing protein 13-like n=1 Tax=Telopea speciosissima TaxID=54955 RepID=UPI001CC4B979|nr:U-box domain-containing protein 13-like [Telopea speciosissima]
MEEEKGVVIQKLIDIINEISAFSDYRCSLKKQFCNLANRLRLLLPMFVEFRDNKDSIHDDTMISLSNLKEALESTKELLRLGSQGSKIYLVLEREQIMNQFQVVTAWLEQALSGISYDKLEISDEVEEQVELVLAQFRRAKQRRVDAPDVELYEDLLSVYIKSSDADVDPAVLWRLAEKLELMGINDLRQESLALQEMVVSNAGHPGESIEKMSILLEKITDFVLTENPDTGALESEKCTSSGNTQTSAFGNPNSLVIPEAFRCPISNELMEDPVFVSTGQIYERSCIEKWLAAGHLTCPKTKQKLSSAALKPNYVLRNRIAQWRKANGIEPRFKIDFLFRKLTSGNLEDQRSAAGELCLVAKRNASNIVCIAKAGVIHQLVGLIVTSDPQTQENALTVLLNLSKFKHNRESIISSGAAPAIVHMLQNGSMEARENAVAILCSLSMVDEYKLTIGASGAIPALVTLLSEGSHRLKTDASTTLLFLLCNLEENGARAVQAGVVPTLMRMLTDPGVGLETRASSILVSLAGYPEGKAAIEAAEVVGVKVEVLRSGQSIVITRSNTK